MAVARVIGTVDGVEVMLNHTGGDRWEVPVPFDEDGEYVVEVMAEDEAGNRAYMTKMLFVVSKALLCAHILYFPYVAELQQPIYQAELIAPECGGIGPCRG